jgi:hypothetical protein
MHAKAMGRHCAMVTAVTRLPVGFDESIGRSELCLIVPAAVRIMLIMQR